jgi:hypothetical protein
VVVVVFAVTTLVARTAGRTATDATDGGAVSNLAGAPRGGRGQVPLWLPVVLSYGVVLGAVAAR